MKPCLFLWVVFQFFPSFLPAQVHAEIVLAQVNNGAFRTIERSNLSRYDNGKYIGHVFRETRATLNPTATNTAALLYEGNFFVLEETLRDMQQSARAVNEVVPVSYRILPSGDFYIDDDRGLPSLRGFPTFPKDPVGPGSKWTAKGVRVVDPLNEGNPVAVPIIAEYEYQGIEDYRDIPVHRISARYASRYQAPARGSSAGQLFTTLQGSHQVEILLRVSDGLPLLMRDNMDETFTWTAGEQKSVRFRGFIHTFGEGTIPLNAERVIAAFSGSSENNAPAPAASGMNMGIASDSNIELAPVPGGIRLTIKDIRFASDSDKFLAEEYPRLDKIAEALKQIPDCTFLVEGHTAAVGRPDGEMELSILRAKRMVDELTQRGINAGRFMYKGWGSQRPLADNASETGRAQNRRVEITILE